MRLEQWKSIPNNAAWAHRLFSTAQWKELVQVMQEGEHVRLFDSTPDVSAERKLGRIEGWDLYNSMLAAAGAVTNVEPLGDPDFQTPEIETEQPTSRKKK